MKVTQVNKKERFLRARPINKLQGDQTGICTAIFNNNYAAQILKDHPVKNFSCLRLPGRWCISGLSRRLQWRMVKKMAPRLREHARESLDKSSRDLWSIFLTIPVCTNSSEHRWSLTGERGVGDFPWKFSSFLGMSTIGNLRRRRGIVNVAARRSRSNFVSSLKCPQHSVLLESVSKSATKGLRMRQRYAQGKAI